MTRAGRSLCAAGLAVLAVAPWFDLRPALLQAALLDDSFAGASTELALVAAAPPEPSRPRRSPGARVEQLAGSGDARDALRAAELIGRCLHAREREDPRDVARACQDITAVQVRSRLALLETAARGGAPGAATAWTGEGPFGDKSALAQRPDDPLVVEWVAQAVQMIRAAARRDDVAAITQLGWLAVHWELSESAQLDALLHHASEWQPGAARSE